MRTAEKLVTRRAQIADDIIDEVFGPSMWPHLIEQERKKRGEKALPIDEHPFEDERLAAERRVERLVAKALASVWEGVRKRLKAEVRGEKALSDIPADQAFWDEQKASFFTEAGTLPSELLLQGAEQAAAFGLAIDFDLVNQGVLELSRTFSNEWWDRLERTTRDGLRAAVQTHIETGAPLDVLEKNLEPLFGKKRAQTIASTETTRLFADGNNLAYAQAGVDTVEWRTSRDGRVCHLCGPLHKQRFPVNTRKPPEHVRCRCWEVPVVDGKPLEGPEETTPDPLGELLLDRAAKIEDSTEKEAGKIAIATVEELNKTSEGRALLDTIGSYAQTKEGSRQLREAATSLLSGEVVANEATAERARVLLRTISRQPLQNKAVYRGLKFESGAVENAFISRHTVGATIDIPIGSASESEGWARSFLPSVSDLEAGKDVGGGVEYIVELHRGLPISPISSTVWEHEVVLSGRFEVLSVETVPQWSDLPYMMTRIALRQVDTLAVPK